MVLRKKLWLTWFTTVPESELAKPEEHSRASTSSQKRTFLLVLTRFSVDLTIPHWAIFKTKVLHSSSTHSKFKDFYTAPWVFHELFKESEHRDEVKIPLEVFQDTSKTLLPKAPNNQDRLETPPESLVEPCSELSWIWGLKLHQMNSGWRTTLSALTSFKWGKDISPPTAKNLFESLFWLQYQTCPSD